MDDGLGNIEVFPNHFESSEPTEKGLQRRDSARTECSPSSHSLRWAARKAMTASSLLKLLSLPRLSWASSSNGDDKVEMSIAEVESLKSEIAEAEEREHYLKAQLEHVDGVLRSARLAGYLYLRTRWTKLPGEPPIIDDIDIDDWLPRFVILHGPCIFYYFQSIGNDSLILNNSGGIFLRYHMRCVSLNHQLFSHRKNSTLMIYTFIEWKAFKFSYADLSPLDTTLLSDVVEVGSLPSFTREDQTHYAFYILTCHGLRFECSSLSKIQVDSWLTALQVDCNLGQDPALRNLSKSQ